MANEIDPSLPLEALREEREELRKKAETYKGSAKGRITPRAAEIDHLMKNYFTRDSVANKIYLIYQDQNNFKNVFSYTKIDEEKTLDIIFAEYAAYIYSLDRPENIFSTKQDFSALLADAEGIDSKFARSRKFNFSNIITAILDGYSTLQKIIELYDGNREKFFPPLSSFMYKLKIVSFEREKPIELSKVISAREDILNNVEDNVEICYTSGEAPPKIFLEFISVGFKNDDDLTENKTFAATASEGITATVEKADKYSEKLEEKLTPRYGDSSTFFTLVAVADYTEHRHGVKNIIIKLQYSKT
jgi:hypothetical protein